ncbi:MAG: hypothetical protein WDO24_16530 [Pseudomonadota bacterium]
MISRLLTAAGVAMLLALSPASAGAGDGILLGPGASIAAFGLTAALLSTHARAPMIYPAPSVIFAAPSPPVIYARPPAAEPLPSAATH